MISINNIMGWSYQQYFVCDNDICLSHYGLTISAIFCLRQWYLSITLWVDHISNIFYAIMISVYQIMGLPYQQYFGFNNDICLSHYGLTISAIFCLRQWYLSITLWVDCISNISCAILIFQNVHNSFPLTFKHRAILCSI